MTSQTYDDYDDVIFPDEEDADINTVAEALEDTAQGQPYKVNPTVSPSLLSIDVGTAHTRAMLFDAVEGRYRFLAGGTAPTTAGAPMFDASEGVHTALDALERISGRTLTTKGADLIVPSTSDGLGVDHLAVTLSAARPLKVAIAGLLREVSLASARNLVNATYTDVVAALSISERNIESQLNAIMQARPDVIVVAGGTNDGASRSVLKMVNSLTMAVSLIDQQSRPDVLFAGNHALAERVDEFVKQYTYVHVAPNIRPNLRSEHLGPAEARLADVFRQRHTAGIKGIDRLNQWSNGNLQPTASAFGRVMRFLSRIVPSDKGVLGVDVGASNTAVAAAFDGDLRLRVLSDLGIGGGLNRILQERQLTDITRWIPIQVHPDYVLNTIQNKIIYPRSLPASREDMAIEQALAREILRLAMDEVRDSFPRNAPRIGSMLPMFNPIFVRGAIIAEAPTLAQSLLMILDGLEPAGIQQIIVDKNHLTPALGGAAAVNPLLVSQLLFDPVAFANLGYVIAPVVQTRPGNPVLRVRIEYDTGHENVVDVAFGNIQLIPLPRGRHARIFLDPLQRADIGAGPGQSIAMESITGGPFGIVIDARGRPLQLARKPEDRLRQLQTWHMSLGRG